MITDPGELTPVELHDGRWYKRDDLFVPFADVPLSGGKVRQAMLLLEHERETIEREHGGVVLTATGVHSPQGLIIARVCEALELGCVIFVGATTLASALTRHGMLRRATMHGATIDARAGTAYEPALAAAAREWQREHDGAGYFVRFGINLEDDPRAIIGSTATQCANVPEDVERIVIAVGAGITAAGIIIGARTQLGPNVRVVCVQIAGYDRRPVLDRIVGKLTYDWHAIEGVPYARRVARSVDGITLDPIYEAKAHDWLLEHADLDGSTTCFWLVGDSSAVRS